MHIDASTEGLHRFLQLIRDQRRVDPATKLCAQFTGLGPILHCPFFAFSISLLRSPNHLMPHLIFTTAAAITLAITGYKFRHDEISQLALPYPCLSAF